MFCEREKKAEPRRRWAILALLFVGIAIGIRYWIERRRAGTLKEEMLEAKLSSIRVGFFAHSGHAWEEIRKPDLVTEGKGRTKTEAGKLSQSIQKGAQDAEPTGILANHDS